MRNEKLTQVEYETKGREFVATLNSIIANRNTDVDFAQAINVLYSSTTLPSSKYDQEKLMMGLLSEATNNVSSESQAKTYVRAVERLLTGSPDLHERVVSMVGGALESGGYSEAQALFLGGVAESVVAEQYEAAVEQSQHVVSTSSSQKKPVSDWVRVETTIPKDNKHTTSDTFINRSLAATSAVSLAALLHTFGAPAATAATEGEAISPAVYAISQEQASSPASERDFISIDGITEAITDTPSVGVVESARPFEANMTISDNTMKTIAEINSSVTIPLPSHQEDQAAIEVPSVPVIEAPKTGREKAQERETSTEVIPIPDSLLNPAPNKDKTPVINPEEKKKPGKLVGWQDGAGGKQELVYFIQSDEKWANEAYRKDGSPESKGNLADCGCGPVSFATAISTMTTTISTMTKNENDPKSMAKWFMEHGGPLSSENCSSNWIWSSNPEAFRNDFGIDVKSIVGSNDPGKDGVYKERDFDKTNAALKKALDNGGMVLMSQRAGTFSHGGHILLLTGYFENEQGELRYFVADPNNRERTLSKEGFSALQVIGDNTPVEGVGYGGEGADRGDLRAAWALYPVKADAGATEKDDKKDGHLAGDFDKLVEDAKYASFAAYITANVESVGSGSKYNPMDPNEVARLIDKYDKKYNHPVITREFMAPVFWQESKYDPRASSGKADGFGQFTPGTARDRGLKDVWNAEESIDKSFDYYIAIYEKFKAYSEKYNWPDELKTERHLLNMTLAGYNAGPNYDIFKQGKMPNNGQTNDYREVIFKDFDKLLKAQKKAVGRIEKNTAPKGDGASEKRMNQAGNEKRTKQEKALVNMAEVMQKKQKWDDIVSPVPSKYSDVSSPVGIRGNNNYHRGVDYPMPVGTPFYAVFDGVITIKEVDTNTKACNDLLRSLGHGTRTNDTMQKNVYLTAQIINDAGEPKMVTFYYGHLSEFKVKNGEVVKAGRMVGLSGDSGCSTGGHAHFEGSTVKMPSHTITAETIVADLNKAYAAIKPGQRTYDVVTDIQQRLKRAKSPVSTVASDVEPMASDDVVEVEGLIAPEYLGDLLHDHDYGSEGNSEGGINGKPEELAFAPREDEGAGGLLVIDHTKAEADVREEDVKAKDRARKAEERRKQKEIDAQLKQIEGELMVDQQIKDIESSLGING